MQAILLSALLAVAQAPQTSVQPRSPQTATARAQDGARLALIEEADIPAANPGVLTKIDVKEGHLVQQGAQIAQIDDREATGKKRLADFEFNAAVEEAKSDVRVRAAAAAQKVAEKELEQALETRRRAPNSVSDTELRRLELSAERYGLEVEVAQKDLEVARITRDAKGAAVDLSELELTKLNITSPIDGRVEQVYKHVGEWVQPGDPIARVVRMDRLRVEGDFNSELYSPDELVGRPVTVEVRLAGNRLVRLEGEVTFVSLLVDLAGDYQVWAEVENREENGVWLLQPGLKADMVVHLAR
jgi:multidrug resistance efflux pump